MASLDCWCLEYHFIDLEDREICEHGCHEGRLDARHPEEPGEFPFPRLLPDEPYVPPMVNPVGYLRSLWLKIPVTWMAIFSKEDLEK